MKNLKEKEESGSLEIQNSVSHHFILNPKLQILNSK